MRTLHDIKITLSKHKAHLMSEYPITTIAIFGSYARNTQSSSSDIDISVELGKKMSLMDFVGLKLDLEDDINKKVDL